MKAFKTNFSHLKHFNTYSVQRGLFDKFYKDVVDVAPKEFNLEELKRPVGMEESPKRTTIYSRGNSFKDMFDQQKTNKRSKELGLEFSKSGMYDINIFRRSNGKLFLSPLSYWRSEKSLYVPHIVGSSLLDGKPVCLEDVLKGNVSVLRLYSSQVGDEICKGYLRNKELELDYLDPETYGSLRYKGIQIVDVNLVDSRIKYAIMRLFISRLRSNVQPMERHSQCLLANREQLPFTVREALQINNAFTGFTIIVDPLLKIRWMASGDATTDEFKTLWKCVKGIRKESFG